MVLPKVFFFPLRLHHMFVSFALVCTGVEKLTLFHLVHFKFTTANYETTRPCKQKSCGFAHCSFIGQDTKLRIGPGFYSSGGICSLSCQHLSPCLLQGLNDLSIPKPVWSWRRVIASYNKNTHSGAFYSFTCCKTERNLVLHNHFQTLKKPFHRVVQFGSVLHGAFRNGKPWSGSCFHPVITAST